MDDNPFPVSGVSGPLTLEEHYALLMAPMDRCLRAIIEERVLPEPRERTALSALTARFGIGPDRLRRLESDVRDRLTDLAAFHAVALVNRAETLATDLGPRAPLDSERTRRALSAAVADVSPAREAALRRLLLRIAGYRAKDGWLVGPEARSDGAESPPGRADTFSRRGARAACARARAPR